MKSHDWFIFDKAIVNGLEQEMIDFINNYMDELESKYDEVYLIRNHKKVKITEIGKTRGFMPDFPSLFKGYGMHLSSVFGAEK
ncbi:hypothetical protein [Paracerasibacillus soli]|uniref:Uncharacterized protein n=1 Tax=Paracerasibacillus soli TaxID=480284 RepID=A0ABU5CM00_9BACI|nr:hypothetical protein [Virgibacillus soli]MDY0407392.1 hypothetical protein [Virgibacillus soli]